MKGMLFIIPLMIIGIIIYILQAEKVNKDIQVRHQEVNTNIAKFDLDFDSRWGDKSPALIAQERAKVESEQAKLDKLYVQQNEQEKSRESEISRLKGKLNTELNNQTSKQKQHSIYDDL